MGQHALLSASGAHRWMKCTPSAKLEQTFPDSTSVYAQEGTLAHEIGETYLLKYTGAYSTRKYNAVMKKLIAHELYSEEVLSNALAYSNFVIEKFNQAKKHCKDPILQVEERIDFSNYVPEGFGTGDAVIIADDDLEIIDLKYGKGVAISCIENPQMMLYALGSYEAYSSIYDIKQVTMTVFQPRLDNISSYTLGVDALIEWGDNHVSPLAQKAFKGEGEFVSGEHCKFCRAKATCRARAEKNLEMAKHDFKKPDVLDDEEIGEILKAAKELQSWASDIWDYAFSKALDEGKKWEGFKLVEGRSNRKYADEEAVKSKLETAGYKDIYNIKLKGITAMEKLLSKPVFKDLIGDLIVKPQGKPVLVEATDKRKELDSACSEFKVEE